MRYALIILGALAVWGVVIAIIDAIGTYLVRRELRTLTFDQRMDLAEKEFERLEVDVAAYWEQRRLALWRKYENTKNKPDTEEA